MIITHHGGECFRVQVGDTTIAFNPPGSGSKIKTSRFGADVALISLEHEDFNAADTLSYGEKTPFVVSGPGEYEVKEIFIKGFATNTIYGGEKKINTIYSVLFDGMKICFLGALGAPDAITDDIRGELADSDILFVPIGGKDVLSPSLAVSVTTSLEPKVIIPMHYEGVGEAGAMEAFLKEEGGDKVSPIEKLTLKKKDIEGREGDVVVLAQT